MRFEAAYLLGSLLIDGERHHCSHRWLVPVIAGVQSARYSPEGLQSALVRCAGAREAQVDRVALGPTSASQADDERRPVFFDGSKGVPLWVSEDAR